MNKLVFALAALCAFGVSAQSKVGTIENVSGAVTVGGTGIVSKAVDGMPLVNGNTILVPSDGEATVVLDNGCSFRLQSSQHLVVNSDRTCKEIIASVRSTAAPVGSAGVGGLSPTRFTLEALVVPVAALLGNSAFNSKSSGS